MLALKVIIIKIEYWKLSKFSNFKQLCMQTGVTRVIVPDQWLNDNQLRSYRIQIEISIRWFKIVYDNYLSCLNKFTN